MREINELHRFIRIYPASCGRSLTETAGSGGQMASFLHHFWLHFPFNPLCCGQLRNFKDGFVLQKRLLRLPFGATQPLSKKGLWSPDTADLHRPHRRPRFPVFPPARHSLGDGGSSRFHSWHSLILTGVLRGAVGDELVEPMHNSFFASSSHTRLDKGCPSHFFFFSLPGH
jgi:hypothetical protein